MKVSEKILLWVCRLLIVVSFCFNYPRVFDRKMDTNGDNYNYYLLAQNLAEGKGYISDVGPRPEPHLHFPPGYPVFMSLFLYVFPDNVVAMKAINGILLLVSLLLLFRIVRKTTGKHGLWYALIACLLCTFHGELLRWATIMMSEMLYLLISLGIIALCLELDMDRVRSKDWRHIARLAGICLLCAAAYFVRTIGISVVLAVALAFFVQAMKGLRRRKTEGRRWLVPLLACALVLLSLGIAHESWSLRNHRVAPGWHSDYLDSFQAPSSEAGSLDFWKTRIGINLTAFISFYIPYSVTIPVNAVTTPESIDMKHMHWWLGLLIIGLMVIGFLSMKGLQWLLLSYVLITFGVLMVYPPSYAGMRYFVPLLPLLIAALVVGFGSLLGWIVRKLLHRATWLPLALTMLAAAALIPFYFFSQVQYWMMADSASYESNFQQLIDASVFSRELPEEWITATTKPEIFYFHSNRHHAISVPRTGSAEETIKYLEDNQVDMVLIDRWFPTTSRQITPMLEHYSHRFSLIERFGDMDHPTALLHFEPEPRE